jgi:hypothetical protein
MIDEIRSKVSKIIRDRVEDYSNRDVTPRTKDMLVELTKLHYDIDGVFAEAIITKYQADRSVACGYVSAKYGRCTMVRSAHTAEKWSYGFPAHSFLAPGEPKGLFE